MFVDYVKSKIKNLISQNIRQHNRHSAFLLMCDDFTTYNKPKKTVILHTKFNGWFHRQWCNFTELYCFLHTYFFNSGKKCKLTEEDWKCPYHFIVYSWWPIAARKVFFLQDLLQCGFEMTRGLVNDNRIFISKYVGGFLSPKMHTSNAF